MCNPPPGTSKWNNFEHRMFCHITQNWRGKPLEASPLLWDSSATSPRRKGQGYEPELTHHPTARQKSIRRRNGPRIRPHPFHGEWSYAISRMSLHNCSTYYCLVPMVRSGCRGTALLNKDFHSPGTNRFRRRGLLQRRCNAPAHPCATRKPAPFPDSINTTIRLAVCAKRLQK